MSTKNSSIIALRNRAVELGLVPSLQAAKRMDLTALRRLVVPIERDLAAKLKNEQVAATAAQIAAEAELAWTSVRQTSAAVLERAAKGALHSEAARKGHQSRSNRALAQAAAADNRRRLANATCKLAERWGANLS